VHDQPEATEEEQEQAQGGRQAEEEAMRYPGRENAESPEDRPAEDSTNDS
jgi:hypothetical protein